MRLRTRFFLGFFILTAGGFYFLVDWVLDDLRPHYLETSEEALVDNANILASVLEAGMQDDSIPVGILREAFKKVPGRRISARVYDFTKTHVDVRVYVTDSTGTVLFDSDDGRDEGKDYSKWRDVFLTLKGSYGARSTRADPAKAGSSELFVAAPIRRGERIVGVLTVSKPSHSINLFIQAARPKIMWAGLIAAMSVAALGMVLAALVTYPIKRLTDYARSIRDGKPMARPAFGRSEIGEMGRAFEEMREALEGKKYVEAYVHTLTHELKSPISSVRGAVELLQEDMPAEKRTVFLENIRSEANRMQSLVDRMLDLSGLESRRGLGQTEHVNISELAEEMQGRLGSSLAQKDIHWFSQVEPGLVLVGEKFLLQQAMTNLLENAIAFTPRGGKIELRVDKVDGVAGTARIDGGARVVRSDGPVTLGSNQGEIRLQILDSGPGIPDYARERVFEKFYSLQRPDTGKKSSGLGLTIVQEITRLHRGKIRLENRPGGGLQVVWSLPLG